MTSQTKKTIKDHCVPTESDNPAVYRKGLAIAVTLTASLAVFFSMAVLYGFSDIHLFNLAVMLVLFVSYFLFFARRFWIWQATYFFVAGIYPWVHVSLDGGIAFAGIAYIIPFFVAMLTNSIILAFINFIFQVIFIKYQFVPTILGLLNIHDEERQQVLTIASFATQMWMFISIAAYDYSVKAAQKKAIEAKTFELAFTQQNSFLLSLSHELRNPLNSMIGNIQLCLFHELPTEVKGNLEDAEIAGEILLQFINNILDGGKSEAGTLEIKPSTTDVHTLLEKIWSISRKIISNKGLKGTLFLSKKISSKLLLDSYRITQIFLNLIGNSVKYTDYGRISVIVDWISGQSKVTDECFEPAPFDHDEGAFEKHEKLIQQSGEYECLNFDKKSFKKHSEYRGPNIERGILKIIVGDTGCGIAYEDLGKVFQKFKQFNRAMSNRQIGTGLGLYITKQLVAKMGGDIRVYSREKVGSYFVICIPMMTCAPNTQTTLALVNHPEQPIKPIRKRQINSALVVDDDQFNVKINVTYLEKAGYNQVHKAYNGAEAYDLYVKNFQQRKPIDLIAMDYDMPVLDGENATKKIRHFERQNGIEPCLIFIISGHCDQKMIDKCLSNSDEGNANEFMKKPLMFEDLTQIIKKYSV